MAKERRKPPVQQEDVIERAIQTARQVGRDAQLAWHLFWDRRVAFRLKLIPLGGLVYLISPIDFIPDPALGIGQLDDVAVILLALKFFIEACPKGVVEEVRRRLKGQAPTPPSEEKDNPGVVEGEFRVL